MIQYVQTHNVSYCIVHKVDRLARNRADDVAIHLALRDAGVMLVSATENIDETPSGMLLHGIMSTIAEFYSRNLATEVVKGMSQKAASGGTIGKAPVGYLNALSRDDLGREVRSVVIDEQRAPHIRWAFQAYASGDWSISQLADELIDRGLTSPPTPRRPSKPLALSTVHRMLTTLTTRATSPTKASSTPASTSRSSCPRSGTKSSPSSTHTSRPPTPTASTTTTSRAPSTAASAVHE